MKQVNYLKNELKIAMKLIKLSSDFCFIAKVTRKSRVPIKFVQNAFQIKNVVIAEKVLLAYLLTNIFNYFAIISE